MKATKHQSVAEWRAAQPWHRKLWNRHGEWISAVVIFHLLALALVVLSSALNPGGGPDCSWEHPGYEVCE